MRRSRLISLVATTIALFVGCQASTAGDTAGIVLTASPTRIALGRDLPAVDVWSYGGRVPGPFLRVPHGGRVRVRIDNRLPVATTVHWHGVRVPNAMDGVPGVTQPAIEPGTSFTYEFVAPDPGTYWFHSHASGSEQVERGLQGVLIVEDQDPLPWSQDVAWVVDDWRIDRRGQIDARFDTGHDVMMDGRWGNVSTVNGRTDHVLEARPGERLRLRLINSANARVFALDFGALPARAIAVDGTYAEKPFDPRGFELAPGNRLDLDLTIPADWRGRSIDVVDTFTGRAAPIARIVVADTAPVATPSFAAPTGTPVAVDAFVNAPPDLAYRLAGGGMGHMGGAWTLNGRAFPDAPDTELPRDRPAKIRFANRSRRIHPMHVHGAFFRVVARDGEPAVEPFMRDTVFVHARETVDVVLVPSLGGRWALHCHVLEHAEAGMMTVIAVP